jgi:hypothetical protein
MTQNSQRTLTAVVPRRSRGENTFAIVAATVDPDFADEQPNEVHALFGGLAQAVTDWFLETKTGESVIRSNNFRFNVGDLAEWGGHASLVPFLREQGIQSISVTTYADCSGHCWEFEDGLIDRWEVETQT